MLTFLQYIAEIWKPERAIKGWMSPSGTAHLIDQHTEHKDSHHPEYLKQGGKQGDHLQHAQAKGFVRFGGNINSMHGFHHFVHYDSKHPEGKKTALKALRYMKPDHDDEVTVSGNAGVFKKSAKTGKLYKNAKAVKELDRDAIMPASHAYRHLQSEEVKPRKVGKRIGGEVYVHKDYTKDAGLPHEELEAAKKHLPKDHEYHIVKHNPKEGTFSFIHSHDFETAHEPTVGKAIKVHRDGKLTTTAQKKDPQIYHHKWEMVGDHHKGFDVNQSKERSRHWRSVVGTNREVSSRIGTKSYWDREVVPKLKESIDSTKLRKAANHNDAYHILDSHHGTKGGTPAAGGCGVFAHALHKHLPGSKLVDIHNKNTGHTEHVGVHHGDHVYDAYGAHPAKHFVSRFQKREGVHGDLEMTDHNPERTAKSDISTHSGTVAKMHSHLGKFL